MKVFCKNIYVNNGNDPTIILYYGITPKTPSGEQRILNALEDVKASFKNKNYRWWALVEHVFDYTTGQFTHTVLETQQQELPKVFSINDKAKQYYKKRPVKTAPAEILFGAALHPDWAQMPMPEDENPDQPAQ